MRRHSTPLICAWMLLLAVSSAHAEPDASWGKIEVIDDTWGVSHVFADTDAGALYGLGYVAARDRAFQMHYALRLIQGRSAEVLGDRPSVARPRETTLDHDRKMRTFGFHRSAKEMAGRLDADTRSLMEAYCAGVNDAMSAEKDRLHPLFAQLGLTPEPWTPADCIASWWHLGQFFATDGTRELLHYRNLNAPVDRRGPAIQPAWLDDAVAVVTRDDIDDAWLARANAFAKARAATTRPATSGGEEGPKFSHAWVVGGTRTTTGAAVLVSDPQTPVRFPAIWQEFHVRGKTFDARGIGVPGCPGLLIGWNKHVAWGATALGADQADLFRLKTDADHQDQYSVDGVWKPMTVERETIRVKGGRDVEHVVRRTHFGPVITAFAFAAPGDPDVALKRVPIDGAVDTTFKAQLDMMRSTSARELSAAAAGWRFPSINLVFGDSRGDIGYRLVAAVPNRSPADAERGAAALDGSAAKIDWDGFLPPDLVPNIINPKRGWIASGNHRPIGSFYPLHLGAGTGGMGHTARSWRLYERLGAAPEKMTPDAVLDIHFDSVNPARRDIVRLGVHLRDKQKADLHADTIEALRHLKPWLERGATMDLNDPAAALAMELNTFFRLMATPLAQTFGGGESGISRFLRDATARIDKDPAAKLSDEEIHYIHLTLSSAWRAAKEKYGDDPETWPAAAGRAVTQRKIGVHETLDGFGSLDRAGELATPALNVVDGATIRSQAAQSYTQYIPLHDVDQAMSLLPPGHSERPNDRRRLSTMTLWEGGKLHPAPLSREAVEKAAQERTTLR